MILPVNAFVQFGTHSLGFLEKCNDGVKSRVVPIRREVEANSMMDQK